MPNSTKLIHHEPLTDLFFSFCGMDLAPSRIRIMKMETIKFFKQVGDSFMRNLVLTAVLSIAFLPAVCLANDIKDPTCEVSIESSNPDLIKKLNDQGFKPILRNGQALPAGILTLNWEQKKTADSWKLKKSCGFDLSVLWSHGYDENSLYSCSGGYVLTLELTNYLTFSKVKNGKQEILARASGKANFRDSSITYNTTFEDFDSEFGGFDFSISGPYFSSESFQNALNEIPSCQIAPDVSTINSKMDANTPSSSPVIQGLVSTKQDYRVNTSSNDLDTSHQGTQNAK